MHYKKIPILVPLCLAIGFFSCFKQEKMVEAHKQEQMRKSLVPPKAELSFISEKCLTNDLVSDIRDIPLRMKYRS
jgi:hypothetical protein